MAYHLTVSIDDAQKKFLDDKDISPSKIMQNKIDEIMQEKDPQLFQRKLEDCAKKESEDKTTQWQRFLNNEPDFNKRKLMVFEFLDSIGIDTSDWKDRIEAEREIENANA